MGDRDLEKALEWEPAAEPLQIDGVDVPTPPFFEGTQTVVIERDTELRLTIRADGWSNESGTINRLLEKRDQFVGGGKLPIEEYSFASRGMTCSLRGAIYPLPKSVSQSDDDARTHFVQEGYLTRLRREWKTKFVQNAGSPVLEPVGPPSWRTEWFVNGPKRNVFARGTERRRSGGFLRKRSFHSIDVAELPTGDRISNFDHLFVDTDGIRFAVCRVDKGYAPEWARPIAIEYPSPIPEPAIRLAIEEIVSFLFGRRLMRMGSTTFDATGWSIEDEVISPWGDGIARLCRQPDLGPVPLREMTDDAEKILATLVPRYLDARGTYGLRDALSTYWLAREAPVGADLALYSSAVEALKKAWFKSTRTKSKGVHMAREDFEKLLGDLLAAMTERLEEYSAPRAITNRLHGAYQMGANEQVRAFFDELGLAVGVREEEAMRARNLPAHGGLTEATNLDDFRRHTHAYRSLFDRTLLKLLGYTGAYIDRTERGHPARALGEPTAGGLAKG